MNSTPFSQELDARIAKYDLLCHPFYKAWSAGELSRDDLREYACQYYHHVAALSTYLAQFAVRLEDGELRQAVLANMADEKGLRAGETPHVELWLDFAEGMGASRDLRRHQPVAEIRDLIAFFHHIASEGTPEEALAAFYSYESQIPRLAREKARGLRDMYAVDEKACRYFRSEEHTSELQSRGHLVCRLLLEKKNKPPNQSPLANAAQLHERLGHGNTFD